MIRAVLDTNVLVSSFLRTASVSAQIRRLWLDGKYQLCTSEPMILELAEVLSRPYFRTRIQSEPGEIEEFLRNLRTSAQFPTLELHIEAVIARDPDDDIVLATAWAAKADCIVSGDVHLLELGTHVGISIFSPREFLQSLLMNKEGDNM